MDEKEVQTVPFEAYSFRLPRIALYPFKEYSLSSVSIRLREQAIAQSLYVQAAEG